MRNFNDPRYVLWRRLVRARDKQRCRRCNSTRKLKVHHIKRWADYPTLRFAPTNGITLCRACHDAMWGNEQAYEALCLTLLRRPPAG